MGPLRTRSARSNNKLMFMTHTVGIDLCIHTLKMCFSVCFRVIVINLTKCRMPLVEIQLQLYHQPYQPSQTKTKLYRIPYPFKKLLIYISATCFDRKSNPSPLEDAVPCALTSACTSTRQTLLRSSTLRMDSRLVP